MPTVHGVTIIGISADKTITIAAVGNLTVHEQPVDAVPVPPGMPPPVVDNTLPAPPPGGYNPPSGGAVPTPHKK